MNSENLAVVFDTKMAIQIARIENGHLHVDIDALWSILDKVGDRLVSIISVDGPLQEGKYSIVSSLLSYLTAYKDIAEESLYQNYMPEVHWETVSQSPNQILMWPEPLIGNYNCENTAILLMSVTGNIDNSIPNMENALISAFGWLLSSVTIYHVKKDITEEMLQFLHMIMACSMKVSDQEDFNPFAKLMFAVNDWKYPGDFEYGFHDDMSSPGIRNFKKEKLDILTGLMPERCLVREEILSRFEEVGCCLMPPFSDEIDKVSDVGLHKKLAHWILTGPRTTKTFQGNDVTSTMLKKLVLEWAGALDMSKLPAFKTQIEAPTDVIVASALSAAVKYFKNKMIHETKIREVSEDDIAIIHNVHRLESIIMFERLTISLRESVVRKYMSTLDGEFNEFHRLIILHFMNNRLLVSLSDDDDDDHHHYRQHYPDHPFVPHTPYRRNVVITNCLQNGQWRCCCILCMCVALELILILIIGLYMSNKIWAPVAKY